MARSVPAVVRALDVLELFLDGRGSLSAPEVASALDLPRTTTHELLATLSERDYVERLPDNAHRFRLGVRVSELGSVYADALDVVRDGQALVEEVSARCGEVCQLGLLDRRDVVYVARAGMSAAALAAVDSTPLVANPRRTPAVRTAAGRVLLAHLPRPDLDRRLGGGSTPAAGPDSPAAGPQPHTLRPQPHPAAGYPAGHSAALLTGAAHTVPARSPLPHPSTLTPPGDHRGMRSIPPGMGEHAPGDAAAAERLRIWRELAAVVARGVATDADGVEPASHAIAAAIRDHTGRVVAALEIRTPVGRWEPQRSVGLETLVRRAALRASARLGFRPQRVPDTATAGTGAPGPRPLTGAPGGVPRQAAAGAAGPGSGAPGPSIGAPAAQVVGGLVPGRLAAAHRIGPAVPLGAAGSTGVRPAQATRPPVPVRPPLPGRSSVPVRPVDGGGLRSGRPAALGPGPLESRLPARRPGLAPGLPLRRPLVGGPAASGQPTGQRPGGSDVARTGATGIPGPARSGATQNGTVQNGNTQNGGTPNGSTQNRAAQPGIAQHGTAQHGSTQHGSTTGPLTGAGALSGRRLAGPPPASLRPGLGQPARPGSAHATGTASGGVAADPQRSTELLRPDS